MLKVNNLFFKYEKANVLKNVSFSVSKGEYLAVVGESGSGKSTLLKLLYGEYDLNKGDIFWGKTQILGPAYNLVVGYDFMKYVAQEFDLMPYISVQENIGKHLSNFFPKDKQKRIDQLLEVVELIPFSKTKVKYLSGGQKQRVALARALAKQPEVILLDEPFSHIDNFKKQSLRRNLFKHLKDNNIACLVATHDKEDVLGYADQMIALHEGEIVASNTPRELFNSPKTPLIASFFGEFNIVNDKIVYANKLKVIEHSTLKAQVTNSYFKGNHYLIEALIGNEKVLFEHSSEIDRGQLVYLQIIN